MGLLREKKVYRDVMGAAGTKPTVQLAAEGGQGASWWLASPRKLGSGNFANPHSGMVELKYV